MYDLESVVIMFKLGSVVLEKRNVVIFAGLGEDPTISKLDFTLIMLLLTWLTEDVMAP
jgi:hypothetical protein